MGVSTDKGALILKWDITYNCVLRCVHCYNSDTAKSRSAWRQKFADLPLEQILLILDKCAEGPVTGINFLGGEPFMRKDMPDIIRHGKSIGLEMSSNTNGVLLSEERVDSIAEAGLDMLVVSIDGPDEETHDAVRGKRAFSRMMKNMDHIKKVADSDRTPLQITINTILSENNRTRVEKMFRFIEDLSPFKWNLIGFQTEGVVREACRKLEIQWPDKLNMYIRIGELYVKSFKDTGIYLGNKFMFPLVWEYLIKKHGLNLPFPKITCGAGTSLGFIDPNGNLYPCDRLTDMHPAADKFNFDLSGNALLEHDFHTIWVRKTYDDIFKLIHDRATYEFFKPCSECPYKEMKLCFPCPLYKFSGSGVTWDECQNVFTELCNEYARDDRLEFYEKHADREMTILC